MSQLAKEKWKITYLSSVPKLFDVIFCGKHLVIVVSLLIHLMRDKVKKLRDLGVIENKNIAHPSSCSI
jgi:hypothetical protein